MEFLDRELSRSSRHNRPLALLMLDIDHFRNINAQYGHLGGDLRYTQFRGDVGISAARVLPDEKPFQLVELPLAT